MGQGRGYPDCLQDHWWIGAGKDAAATFDSLCTLSRVPDSDIRYAQNRAFLLYSSAIRENTSHMAFKFCEIKESEWL